MRYPQAIRHIFRVPYSIISADSLISFGFVHIDGVVHRLIAAKQKVYAGILAIGAMRKARQRASGNLVNAAISV